MKPSQLRATFVAGRIATFKNRRALACGATLLLAQAAFAATPNWTGGGVTDTNWTTLGNWSTNAKPVAGDAVTFNDPAVNGNEIIYLNGSQAAGSLSFSNTGTTTILGGVSGTGATNTFSLGGNVTVNSGAGAIVVSQSGAAVTTSLTASATLTNNANSSTSVASLTFGTITSSGTAGGRVLTLDGTGFSIIGSITGAAAEPISVIKNGTGIWQVGSGSQTGGTTINAGTYYVQGANAFGTAAQTLTINGGTIAAITSGRNIPAGISVAVGGDFTLGGQGQPVTFAGPVNLGGSVRSIIVNNSGGTPGDVFFGIVSNGGITKLGNSTLTLSNTGNTYTGLTTVSAGTLGYGANDVISTGDVLVNNTGTLAMGTTHTDTVGTVTLNSSGGITGDTGSTLTSTTSFEMQSGTVSAILAGTNIPLNKTTSGTVTLSSANTYTGQTNINDGILQANATGALGGGTVSMTGVRLGLGNGVTIGNAITLGAAAGSTGHGLIESNGTSPSAATYSGTINITATPTNGGHFAALAGDTLVVSGPITSTVPVTQRTGTVLYGGGGTGYSALSITGTGGLINNNGIATTAVVNVGVSGAGTLDLTGFDQTLGGISSTTNSAIITNSVAGTKTLTVGNNDITSTFNGAIQNGAGSVALAKIGNGATALGGALNVTASTAVSAGKLLIAESGTHNRILQTGTVTITGGQLDVADNKLVTTTSAGTPTAGVYTAASVQGMVQSGRSGGAWTGSGIVTSETDAQGSSSLTTLAVATAADVGFGGTKTFGGQTVNGTDTLVMYTYAGDMNLDGQINGDDYFRIDAGYTAIGNGYENGDLNYDGRIDADDYFIIDKNYGNQTLGVFPSAAPVLSLAGVSAVPEPASLGMIVVAAGAFMRRRRRD